MKTTIDIADALLSEAKRVAGREGSTVRALVEEGLRRTIEDRKRARRFRMRRVTFRGKGLRPQVADGSWEAVRDLIYQGRGA